MRPILALGILLLGLSSAAPEPEYSALFADYFRGADGDSFTSLVEIESSTGRTDRLTAAALRPRALSVEILKPGNGGGPVTLASADPDLDAIVTGSVDTQTNRGTEVSLDDLCHALFTSAQNNDLPIPFFANLIWQESRLRDDAISSKGAMGIAQFMPEAAAETGLEDPFDPLQAIPASARLLRTLRMQFGNLGFVAAAYNAGAHRVAEWLEHRGSLPRETRGYVVRVTGLSVEAWRSMPVNNNALTFVRPLPCRSLPAFAGVEQEQLEQAQLEQARLEQAKLDELPVVAEPAADDARKRSAERKHGRPRDHHEARRTSHDRRAAKREAAHTPRAAHEKHKSA